MEDNGEVTFSEWAKTATTKNPISADGGQGGIQVSLSGDIEAPKMTVSVTPSAVGSNGSSVTTGEYVHNALVGEEYITSLSAEDIEDVLNEVTK